MFSFLRLQKRVYRKIEMFSFTSVHYIIVFVKKLTKYSDRKIVQFLVLSKLINDCTNLFSNFYKLKIKNYFAEIKNNFMSKLFKSKILLGVMMLGLVIGGFAVSKASAADCSITMSLSMGMRNSQVTCLQNTLGVSPATGYFGSKTKAAVVAWQAANGLPSTGLFGSMSRAKLAGGSTVATTSGCAAGAMFNSTTGAPCSTSTSTSTVAGCAAGAMFSSTTGASCSGSTSTVVSGTNGYLADIANDSTNRVSTVYESEQDKVVAGFRATARLSSQNVNRVRVTFRNTDTSGSSASLAKYASAVSLWNGSTKLATMAVASADRSTSDDTYTFNFAGLNAPVAQDQIGHFYVSVSANGSIDSGNSTDDWTVAFPDGGVSASSPDGSYDTYNASAGNVTGTDAASGLGFGKFSANGVKATINLSSGNPSATVVGVNSTSATNGVKVLEFTVKATNSDLHLRKVPIQLASTTATISSIVNTVYLMQGSNQLASLSGSSGTGVNSSTQRFSFTSIATPFDLISSGETKTFSVVIDFKPESTGVYADGETLTASLTNADAIDTSVLSMQDTNGDQVPAGSIYRVGSAIGGQMTLQANGANVVMGTPIAYANTTASNGDISSVTYTIPVSITAFGNTLYLGQTAEENAAMVTASNAFALVFQKSDGTVATATASNITFATTDALVESNGFRLDSGTTKHFTIEAMLITPATNSSQYRVWLKKVQTFTDAGLTSGNGTTTSLLPAQSYQTGYKFITN